MAREKKKALASPANLDLFAPPLETMPFSTIASQNGLLPNVEELYVRFRSFNVQYFGGRLPTPRIRYSRRLLAAGLYIRNRNEIVISSKYHEIFPLDIDDTLKHEMIHIIHFNHNREFKQEAERIGASTRAKTHGNLRMPARYIYECRTCKTQYPRRRRLISASCGKCSPSRFDAKFKLSLRKKLI